jgi:hypothetical protein
MASIAENIDKLGNLGLLIAVCMNTSELRAIVDEHWESRNLYRLSIAPNYKDSVFDVSSDNLQNLETALDEFTSELEKGNSVVKRFDIREGRTNERTSPTESVGESSETSMEAA